MTSIRGEMNYLYSIAILFCVSTQAVLAQSNLLESVKQNPEEAKALCNKLRNLNARGISSGSKEAIDQISRERKLNTSDAEILSIYVIGLHCPEVN